MRRTQRGAALVYAVILSLVAAAVVGGYLQNTAQTVSHLKREEQRILAYSALDRAFALHRSEIKSNPSTPSFATSGTINRVDYDVTGTRYGDLGYTELFIEGESATGRRFKKPYNVGLPIDNVFYAATRASEGHLSNGTTLDESVVVGHNDGDGARTSAYFSGRPASMSWSQFQQPLYISPDYVPQLELAAGIAVGSIGSYELVAFCQESTTTAAKTIEWEFRKGDLTLTVTTNSSNGTGYRVGTLTGATYYIGFCYRQSGYSSASQTRFAIFDFDALPGGTAFKNSTEKLVVTAYSNGSSNRDPNFDTLALIGSGEEETENGWMVEYSQVLRWPGNNGAGGHTPAYVRRVTPVMTPVTGAPASTAIGHSNDWGFWSYSGWWTPSYTGTAQFRVTGASGSRIWVNSSRVLDAWAYDEAVLVNSSTFNVTAGVPVHFRWESWEHTTHVDRGIRIVRQDGSIHNLSNSEWTPDNGTRTVEFSPFMTPLELVNTWNVWGYRTGTGADGQTSTGTGRCYFANGEYMVGDIGGSGNYLQPQLGTQAAGEFIFSFQLIYLGTSDVRVPFQILINGSLVASFRAETIEDKYYSGGVIVQKLTNGSTVGKGIWNVRLQFTHTGGNLTIQLRTSGSTIQGIDQESWCVDSANIRAVNP